MEVGKAVDFALPISFFGEREIGGVRQGFDDAGVPVTGELRQQLVADAVPGEIESGVCCVLPPWNPAFPQENFNLWTLDVNQRTNDAPGGDGVDGGKSGGTGSAQ
jgi:hypothetical protein